jgi:hypothetical protein
LASERLSRGGLDGLRHRAARLHFAALAVVVPSADDLNIRMQGLAQRFPHDFGTNAPGITDDNGETRTRRHD